MTRGAPSSKIASKSSRLQLIASLLEHQEVRSQAQLLDLLKDEGVAVTQATLSRDLVELGAGRVNTDDGGTRYQVSEAMADFGTNGLGGSRLARVVRDLLTSTDASGNIVVLRTPPGGAQYLASAIDHGGRTDIIGTVAGDDTVLLVTRDPAGARLVADQFAEMASRHSATTRSVKQQESVGDGTRE